MSEELIQRGLVEAPEKIGNWNYYNIGSTTLKSLKGAKIIPDRDYEEYEVKKPDAIICKNPIVVAAIEYKPPSRLRTQRQIVDAIEQEIGTARALQAKVYIVTDGGKTFWINPMTGNEIIDEEGQPLRYNFSKESKDTVLLLDKIMISIDANNDQLKPPNMIDPLPLAKQVWQDLWAVSGATPESCLYTFVEIFIFKYLSDLGVLRGIHSFSNLLAQYADNTDEAVLEFYASTVRTKIKQQFPGNPKDNTTIINGTIFVSKDDAAVSGYATVFKKILRRFETFGNLENIDYDFKSKLFETFLKESISKKNWGQFFTPLKVVRAIVDMVDIRHGMTICDPACGVGKFLLEPILRQTNDFYVIKDGKLIPQIKVVGFDKGFDRDEQKTIILAKANMLIYLSDLIKDNRDITHQFAELFNSTFTLQTNSILGTLSHPIENEYDLILTNPPYVMSGSSNLKEEISKSEKLKKHFSVNAMGIEGLFMEWIVRALKEGGQAFIVVPDGIMNRGNDKKLRRFILEECFIDAVISLPLNTFFTTSKKTYILAVTKKRTVYSSGIPTKPRQTAPVFTYLCSEIGETRDVYRFDIEQNDLTAAVSQFNMFKGAKTTFESFDPRCKVKDIDVFYNSSHWSVDRWWTYDEKVDLGIEDEGNTVDILGFASMLSDITSTILGYGEPLRESAEITSSLVKTVKINLSDTHYFDLAIGKRVLKKDFFNQAGDIPYYSSNVFEPFGYGDSTNITDFEHPYVLWGIDGDYAFNVMEKGQVFATTDHCGTIKIKDDLIDPKYLAYVLEGNKHKYGFDRGLRASLKNMKRVTVDIPVTEDGQFDLDEQLRISGQNELVRQVRTDINEQLKRLDDIRILLG